MPREEKNTNTRALPREIERKFLVRGDSWRKGRADGTDILQSYIVDEKATTRVRCVGGVGYITIKGTSPGAERLEFEYEIPRGHAEAMLEWFCRRPPIEKKRYDVWYEGRRWVIDEFKGPNQGLILAEIEMVDLRAQIGIPSWAGAEVTDDPRFRNSSLARNPHKAWKK